MCHIYLLFNHISVKVDWFHKYFSWIRRVYHIVTDHAFWVESIVTYHRIYRKKCITLWRITLSIYYTYLTNDFIKPNVEEGSFMPLVLIHTGIVKYLWQILILYSIQFAYPTYSGSPFSDEIAIMVRHYVIHPYLKIRHYVIHPTNCFVINCFHVFCIVKS